MMSMIIFCGAASAWLQWTTAHFQIWSK